MATRKIIVITHVGQQSLLTIANIVDMRHTNLIYDIVARSSGLCSRRMLDIFKRHSALDMLSSMCSVCDRV